ncbi:MAG TPA: NAD(P)-dependent oxidoreductase [Candidatus Baltobacteraceae bacterium]|nr:NAD(P)-dependent oxidoreductase [Candidatus Baltobacteraceae bacterium]
MRKAFFPVSLNLDGRLCVVIGDDREAVEKAAALEESGAKVRRLLDPQSLEDDDVIDAFFVISTPQNEALSARLRALADRHRFMLCCIDQPAYGFVAMTAIAQAGPVRVAISTAGLAPRVGKKLKEALQRAMDANFAAFVAQLARRRESVREAHPRPEESQIRRSDAIEAAEGFEADVAFRYPQWFRDGNR